MKNNPLWLQGIKSTKRHNLPKKLDIDVLIIGGGITGLSTAYHLCNSKYSVCVVEMNKIAHGISSRTTGKITFLQNDIYPKLKSKMYEYYNSQVDAINIVENIIDTNNIDCDFYNVSSFIVDHNKKKIEKEKDCLDKLGVKYNLTDNTIEVTDTKVFHPVKYLYQLRDIIENHGIKVYENKTITKIEKVKDGFKCSGDNFIINAQKVVIASFYPCFLIPFLFPLRTSIDTSYISASISSDFKDYSLINLSKPTKSVRYHYDKDNYYIYLYGSNKIGNKLDRKKSFDKLLSELNKKGYTPEYLWSNHDILTEDHLPYIGFIDDNLLIGTGYNKWGMTNGSLAGVILADLIMGKNNKYQSLFDPYRSKGLKNKVKYPLNMVSNAKSFIENKVYKNKSWYRNVSFEKRNGKNIAIYKDSSGKEHIIHNLCPHMKCSLIFNETELTWDCPCHGSRYDIDGKKLIGPGNMDIGYKE